MKSRLSLLVQSFVRAVIVLSAIGCLPFAALAQYETIVDNGPSSNRVDMVFLGDGYTAADHAAGTYTNHIQGYLGYLFGGGTIVDPYPRYQSFFNVHRIDVMSNQSGADKPGDGVYVDTALDASYWWDGVTERLLYVNSLKADAALNNALAGAGFTAEQRYVTVNDNKYGGGGGKYAVYAGGNSAAHEVALHEMGHSFSGLADEYGGNASTYTGAEPSEPNVTKDPTGAKWEHWIGYDQPDVGVIGAYEGGRYYDHGLYRPTLDSKMRSLGQPFNAVCREQIILDIYDLVDPLDGWLDNTSILNDPASLWVDRIDDSVISMEWFVDDVLVAGATGSSFDLVNYGFGPGTYSITARAYDPTGFDPIDGWVRIHTDQLEQSISWTVVSTVPEPSTICLLAMGTLPLWMLARRRARRV